MKIPENQLATLFYHLFYILLWCDLRKIARKKYWDERIKSSSLVVPHFFLLSTPISSGSWDFSDLELVTKARKEERGIKKKAGCRTIKPKIWTRNDKKASESVGEEIFRRAGNVLTRKPRYKNSARPHSQRLNKGRDTSAIWFPESGNRTRPSFRIKKRRIETPTMEH